ncbi:hypothetical protein SDC9_204627 [bioreactor metagenome]|uniref:Uncharacterized protein n=1 Tax=bioreactor metagenome TaxID=1076179 RepID=A0A645J8X7_9ZZZZ
MQIVGFYVRKDRGNNKNRVKEIQIDVDKTVMKTCMTLIMWNGMTQIAYAGPIADGVKPIIDVLKDLAEPVAYGFMVKGFLQLMSGNESGGTKTIKWAIGGFIGIQWIPNILKIIKNIKF